MTTMTYQQALRLAMTEEMERDPNVFICGEEVGQYQGTYQVTRGMLEKFGPQRVLDTPISEIGIAGLGLPFEQACLDFHRSDRAVRTASSEQVRRPINRDGVGQWRAYEPWLDPLKAALGPALDSWDAAG